MCRDLLLWSRVRLIRQAGEAGLFRLDACEDLLVHGARLRRRVYPRAPCQSATHTPSRWPSATTGPKSGGGTTGLALLALYNLAYIVPLILLLLAVSNRRVLGRLGRWNQASSPWVKASLAGAVILMSLGLLITL